MLYYSTNGEVLDVELNRVVIEGLAADKGLFMPNSIGVLAKTFFDNITDLSFQEMAYQVAKNLFGEDIEESTLKEIVYDTLSFETPIVKVTDNIYSLELFHGPTLAFKDVGARFMARILRYLLSKGEQSSETVHVLAATSGDTGSAVASGFYNVPGIKVHVLYPKGKVSELQEKQFATLGGNIEAIEIDGTFDDCQALVKRAFLDRELNEKLRLTSANSINVARFLPQSFYYFNAYAQLKRLSENRDIVFAVPSGNFGNITAGLFARAMGLPVDNFIAANNENDIVYNYLQSGVYSPRPSVSTIANAMDVGDPSNFVRMCKLFDNDIDKLREVVSGVRYSDKQIESTIKEVYEDSDYMCDPHGAVGYRALSDKLEDNQVGIFLETAHPAKFFESVEQVTGEGSVPIPERLAELKDLTVEKVEMAVDYDKFRALLLL